MPLPDVPTDEDRERFYGVWARFYDKPVPPPHERLFRVRFMYEGESMVAEVGKPVRDGQPPVVAIYGGDPLVVCRLRGGAFSVPHPRVIEAEYFETDD
jgi:hypothetical protein